MIAHITYTCTGSETKTLTETTVNIVPASGYTFLDVILNGYSQDFSSEVTVDNLTGDLVFNQLLGRGDWVIALFRQLPRYSTLTTMVDFDSADFTSDDFA